MKISAFVLCVCSCYFLPVQPEDIDSYTQCEICLTAAQEIEKTLKNSPAESRQAVVEKLLRGGVCEKLSNTYDSLSRERMTSSCLRLMETHYNHFRAALVKKEPKQLDVALCYEHTTTCVGVKRLSFQESKTEFRDSHIDDLLRENQENVRFVQPIRPSSSENSKDEL